MRRHRRSGDNRDLIGGTRRPSRRTGLRVSVAAKPQQGDERSSRLSDICRRPAGHRGSAVPVVAVQLLIRA